MAKLYKIVSSFFIYFLGKKRMFKYIGPISIALQELDGPFNHVVQCEDVLSKHDIACHSKSRRIMKKKIPMSYGEEKEI